ncbi:MAG: sigma-70 family RNA polymerase sigma factor [Thermomicrobiales bacterium]
MEQHSALNARQSHEPEDETLVAQVAKQDIAAFGLLYDRYVRLVYALAARSLGALEAQEIVQEVFLQLWRSASQFDPARGSFGAWFTAIARHRVLGGLRAQRRQRRFAVADAIELALAQAPDPGPSIEELSERAASADAALSALHSLPPEQRRVIVLAYFGGMSQSDIAGHLGIPLGTVKKRTRLGMQRLRNALTSSGDLVGSDAERGYSSTHGIAGEGRRERTTQPR